MTPKTLIRRNLVRASLLACLAGCAAPPPLRLEEPVTLATTGAGEATIAIDSATGTSYVAWAATTDSARNVWFAAARAGKPFGAPRRLNETIGEVASTKEFPPQVVTAGRDTVYVAWIATWKVPDRMAARGLRIVRSLDGGATFDSVRAIGADVEAESPTFAYYDIGAAPGGTVVASWLDLGRYVARLAIYQKDGRRLDGKAARSPENREWAEQTSVRLARSDDGGRTFVTSPVADTLACICCRTAVATAPNGSTYLMWRHVFPGQERDFVVASAAPGGPVRAPVRVHPDRWQIDGCPDIGPDLAVDAGGAVHAAWYTGAPGRQGLHYARAAADTFSAPVPILTGATVPTSEVKLALAGSTPWLVWEDKRPKEIELRLGRIAGGDALIEISDPIGRGRSPGIAATAGRLGLVWTDQGKVVVRLGTLGSLPR